MTCGNLSRVIATDCFPTWVIQVQHFIYHLLLIIFVADGLTDYFFTDISPNLVRGIKGESVEIPFAISNTIINRVWKVRNNLFDNHTYFFICSVAWLMLYIYIYIYIYIYVLHLRLVWIENLNIFHRIIDQFWQLNS